ncbi:hypothetical protein GLOTRDRAFT_95572 [Gloeophyllum trabeum ATCC 11539]|uniref:Uncharacterized protein n=1 Tax=Gloeophyllum trabeum (strain ATCC 11539 / FP-39264 / Madison 617) TaxID=670483 RepID=S7REN5_GLOTA|nr:uncharacterized protein GLOTRDRAFT_95572 [Gloeophyllum trabeum ATCC 11539]EPQ52710.1 hypothetical protein GLOTRDRAFT_95572 [Gloeophyllum trabeum ATCC 11539]
MSRCFLVEEGEDLYSGSTTPITNAHSNNGQQHEKGCMFNDHLGTEVTYVRVHTYRAYDARPRNDSTVKAQPDERRITTGREKRTRAVPESWLRLSGLAGLASLCACSDGVKEMQFILGWAPARTPARKAVSGERYCIVKPLTLLAAPFAGATWGWEANIPSSSRSDALSGNFTLTAGPRRAQSSFPPGAARKGRIILFAGLLQGAGHLALAALASPRNVRQATVAVPGHCSVAVDQSGKSEGPLTWRRDERG